MCCNKDIYFAPLQGYTEDCYRRIHHQLCGGVKGYFTPFVRMEHGQTRSKDMRDIRHDFNEGVPVTPQIIASSASELRKLTDRVLEEGYSAIDINMGCPFPLQTRHGRGAGLLPHPDVVEQVCNAMSEYTQVEFSVKMRLGLSANDEWKDVLPILNDIELKHITLHPRIGEQQYNGTTDEDSFGEFLSACKHKVIYNGDLCSIKDIDRIIAKFPSIEGVMLGRGLLARPTLAYEYANGINLSDEDVISRMKSMHSMLHEQYSRIIPAEAAILSKLRTFWDYAEPTIGRKAWKKLKKAGNMRNYMIAVNEL